MKFDIKQTNIVKGVAVLMLLWHHLFFNSPETAVLYRSVFQVMGIPAEALISVFCKVCVAIFMFLSGYGMFISYEGFLKKDRQYKNAFTRDVTFVKNRLIKLLSSYWVIYIIFVPLGLFFGKSFLEVYGANPLHWLADFFGISHLLFGTAYTMNGTWWYMSVIIVYYLIYPLLHRLCKYSAELLLAVSLIITMMFPNIRELQALLLPFAFGMYVSYRNIFEILSRLINKMWIRGVVSGIIIATFAFIRYRYLSNKMKFDFAFGFGIILLTYWFIGKIPIVNKVLEEFGKKSGLIFMFHTFIYYSYFKDFIYSFKYSVLIFAVLAVICFIVAALLELLMKFSGYQKLIKKMTT